MKKNRLYLAVLFSTALFFAFAGVLPCEANEEDDWLILKQFDSAIERYLSIYPEARIAVKDDFIEKTRKECNGQSYIENIGFISLVSDKLYMELAYLYYEPSILECHTQISAIEFALRDINAIGKGSWFIDYSEQREFHVEEKFKKELLKTIDKWRDQFPK
jgi:hypothetical protein